MATSFSNNAESERLAEEWRGASFRLCVTMARNLQAGWTWVLSVVLQASEVGCIFYILTSLQEVVSTQQVYSTGTVDSADCKNCCSSFLYVQQQPVDLGVFFPSKLEWEQPGTDL